MLFRSVRPSLSHDHPQASLTAPLYRTTIRLRSAASHYHLSTRILHLPLLWWRSCDHSHTHIVLRVEIGTGLHQQLNRSRMALESCQDQRRGTVLYTCIYARVRACVRHKSTGTHQHPTRTIRLRSAACRARLHIPIRTPPPRTHNSLASRFGSPD